MGPGTETDQEVQYAFAQAPQPARQYVGTSSAFSSSASIEEDWTKISDLAERRRIENRIAQRNYRKKLKRRLEDLERRAESTDDAYPHGLIEYEQEHFGIWKCPVPSCKYHRYGWPTKKGLGRHFNDEHSDSQAAMYEIDNDESSAKGKGGEEEPYTIKCICTITEDDGNTIYCETCDTWQHIECFYPNNREEAIREDFAHACADCNPRPLDRAKAMNRPFCQKAHGWTVVRGAQKQPLPVLGNPSTTSSTNVSGRRQQDPLLSSVADEMETYHGYVPTPDDAIKLFEACRLGLLPRVQRRLSEKERQLIRSGSVFIWDEREAGMRRWTDGKSWSASRVSGSFLTYREMERKQGGGFGNDRKNGSKESGCASDEDQHDGEPRDYGYKADGLIKQAFSITTSAGQHLHLVSYYSRPQPGQPEKTRPCSDPALYAIIPVKGMYPELSRGEANQTPPLTRAPILQTYMVPQHPPPGILPSDSGYASVARLKNDSTLVPPNLAQQSSGGGDFDAGDAQDPATDQRGDQDLSDANTVYSDAVSLSGETKESYIDALVDDLLGKLGDLRSQPDLASRLAKLLPALLKTLALGIVSSSRSHESRDIMVFIHKHRFMIAAALESRLKDEQDEDDKSQSQRHRPTEIMDRWLRSETDVDYNEIPENDLRLGDEGDDDDNETSVPALDEYRKLVHSSCSYFWLVGRLQREMNTSESAPGIDAMERIRADLLATIPSEDRVSRREAPQPITAVYATQWSIRDFLSNQAYKGPGSQAIANAITLTGTSTDAQALTCSQYLAQTWPSTGHHTLRLMQLLIDHKSVPPVKITVTDPAPMSLEAQLRGGHVAVTTSGLPEYVAEIGQQLAWMSAAMSSSDESTLCENTPFLDHMNPDDVYKRTVSCDINIRTKPYHKPDDYKTGGQCWHNMFHNPVIACGFPIRSRSKSTLNTGLEMSLDIMAAMTDTRYINVFNSGTFIKGFSSMLVPTGRSEDVLIWHHLYKKNAGERISHWDFQLPYVDVGMAQLETSRHILGWCSDADSLVGSSNASYDIRRSRLPRTHAGCSLDKVELQAGQFVQATAAFTVGKREKPVHISRNGYLDKLNWISSKYVILWDEGDNAGWLCSGTRGLVHLLRASLEHSKGKFKSSFLMDPKSLPDILNSESIDGMDPALSLLLDRHVRQLRLYVDKDWDGEDMAKGDANSKPQAQYYMLQDRVEHLYYIMEKLIEWQTNTEQRSGLSINACPRKQLEGWDFRDVVAGGDPFFPRVTTLPAVGKGWVDFARSIQAVTLFGRGFGQLMKPRATSGLGGPCRIWSALPTGRHYLAARLSDLGAITQDHGDPTSNPVYLSDNVIWHVKAKAFVPCPCTGTNCHHEPVQVLFPSKFTTRLCKKASPTTLLQSNGAVIFGHNKRLRWYWKDFGDPVKGDPEEEVESDSVSNFADSALGSSIESARSPSSDLGSLPSTQSAASLSPAGGSWKRGLLDAASSLNKRARRL